MKKMFYTAVLMCGFITLPAFAGIINNSDIATIGVDAPDKWTSLNESVLFDGETRKRKSERFIGFRNEGDELSESNVFSIAITLNQLFDINSLGFYNDWGYHLQQQVANIRVSLFDTNQVLAYTVSRNDVMLNTFDLINVFTTTNAIKAVKYVTFDIVRIQKTNFEIRELELAYSAISNPSPIRATVVSMPAIGSLIAGFLVLFVFRRFQTF